MSWMRVFRTAATFFASAACLAVTALGTGTRPASSADQVLNPPLAFEENVGQFDADKLFLLRGDGFTLAVGDRRMWLHPESATRAVHTRLVGASPASRPQGLDVLPGKVNYFLGQDPRYWHMGVRRFAQVRQSEVYAGIDLLYYTRAGDRHLEYDFLISPGADPSQIRMEVAGCTGATITPAGDLVLNTGSGQITHRRPVAYQATAVGRRPINAAYSLSETPERVQVAFHVGQYDRSLPLVIDPVLEYSTYLGGSRGSNASGNDDGNGITVDALGRAHVVGRAESVNFPVRNAYDSQLNNGPASSHRRDGFIARMNAQGSDIEFATFVGGLQLDVGFSIAVDRNGNVYASGRTASTDFPTTPGALQATDPDGAGLDGWVVKLGPDGRLLYSTYLGGSTYDICHGIGVHEVVDGSGNLVSSTAVVTGETRSRDFPLRNGVQNQYGGGNIDAFLVRLDCNPSDSTAGATDPGDLLYGSFLGGGGDDSGYGIALDAAGRAYITGISSSDGFPVTANALQSGLLGSSDAFVAGFAPGASGDASLLYSSYLGGSGDEIGYGMALDGAGRVYVAGETTSGNFPTTPAAYDGGLGGSSDSFVAKLDLAQPPASQRVYATYLGGSSGDWGRGVAVDGEGSAYVTGGTASSNFPLLDAVHPDQPGQDGFVTKFNAAGSALVYSTYLGGGGTDECRFVAVDSRGAAYLTGETNSSNFPTTAGAWDRQYGADGDAFVTRIGPGAATYSVVASPGAVAPGEPVRVDFTAPAGRPATDRISLFRVGDGNGSPLASQNTNGATAGTLTFSAPATDGTYEFRYLLSGTTTDVARSNPVTVTTPSTGGEIGFRSAAGAQNGSGATSLSLPLPTGAVAGDALVAGVAVRSSSVSLTPPSGWVQTINASEGSGIRMIVFQKVAGSGEPASFTWTFSGSVAAAGVIASYSGVHTGQPVEAADGWGNGSSRSITAPGISTSSGAMLLNFSATSVATTITPPTGMTERADQAGTGVTISVSDQPRPSAGGSGNRVATAGLAAPNVGHSVSLRPQ